MASKIGKYLLIKILGKQMFSRSNAVRTGKVTQSDIEIVKRLLIKAITTTNPEVFASYFVHVMIAPELGRRIADKLKDKSNELDVRRDEIEFLLWLHEIGRLVDPQAYLKDELIDIKLLTEFGIAKPIIEMLLPIDKFIKAATNRKSTDSLFESLTPSQRIVNLADNFGKRDEKGKLFDLKSLSKYLKTEKSRYGGNPNWKPEYDLLQESIVKNTIKWLSEIGINFDQILKSLTDYGPKFVIVSRHGELENPKNIVYNRDSVMKPEDIIHLSGYGRGQMKVLGKLIKKRKFRVSHVSHSPSTRAVESKDEMMKGLGMRDIPAISIDNLDDVYAPGGYLEGINMDVFKAMGGSSNTYTHRWDKYKHEKLDHLVARIDKTFREMVKNLGIGETGILISHGDPIAAWIQHHIAGKIPEPEELQNGLYPNKGEAIVAIIDPQRKFFTHYILTDPSLKAGRRY
ncbi:hypothetical protein A3C98_04080 [Candidatus Roizmanbacteria bacterium RIFCSPHIGHO2_02_FULL_37_15]|uniref:Histidine phosphatase family protein n=1 Tax=Candidatus Roizmanbacteria bacterium RIFCSPLOWO2_01_FULL_37_16 TaxID=1802058 RepID=A0A1F7IML7_9BACT|nr:MAG: hypothetical protein A2859_04180 [Candidatus Roizmanbacteria bacterium RIFCSPHIGHO2_01_FULL_37_16b]OGK22500.1 MAG: hypothetical protein A3C98_04080 [Candidatus Roizmanbacteria bacterium RIFCSPHIGHO2_02_FULL_37_15]OGK33558.1 MAG: hypothetical protein A3F57_05655 [Candidatus Roizmanbacteria bacterium RIFCSPHIGHO2_12_FULL_36_11]OGK44572.1 MAG: hypothetical protein A3B40_05300 [Candidatus Roizmanbacteria bacterium RIFCSPLOWO2_01_FULL_37_16]OGK55658.1 MAG: hypothetical protein A3I50_01875 [C